MRVSAILVILTVLVASCERTRHGEPQEVTPVYRLFAEYAAGDSVPDDIEPDVRAFMQVIGRGASGEDLAAWAASPAVGVFTPAVDSVFPSLDGVERELGFILGEADLQGLELPRRRYAAVVWGRQESIVFCDSVMLIALNHYLGEDFPGYSHMEGYLRRGKTPANLPVDIAEALVATRYPYEAMPESAVLSRLLYEGALAEAKMRLTGRSAAAVLGYTDDEYARLLEHESDIWRTLVSRQLLYSTLPLDAERLVQPAPSTSVVSSEAPGRVGRFVGFRIVESYQKTNGDVALPELLSPAFYNSDETLRRSGYTGRM